MANKQRPPGRQEGQKQIWMTAEDVANFEAVAQKLLLLGYDVKHHGKFSPTKVLRQLMLRELVDTPQK